MSPLRSFIAPLCAPALGATSVAGGHTGVTDHQQAKAASPVQGAAGPNGSNGDSGREHCAKPTRYAPGSAASGWVKQALVMSH